MTIKKRINNLSELTRELLAEGESARSDFKRLPDGISADDLVAFANSDGGGQILAGVDEQVSGKTQIGVVRGCDVSDATILQVLNKAVSCIPPVSIDVYIENLDDKPLLRVEVPSSQTKPHCTPKGIYCRRDGARNRPMHPTELLRLFLDSEASAFAARFEVAAERITKDLGTLESSLDSSIKNMSDQLGWAESQLGDTESTLDNIQGLVANLTADLGRTNSRMRALFQQDKRDDPVRKKAHLRYVNQLVENIREDDSLLKHVVSGGELTLQSEQPEDGDVTNEDAKKLLRIAVKHVHDTERNKKYQIVIKTPDACSNDEIDQFAAKVAEGGEVADVVRDRVKRAFRLGLIVYDGSVVGTAALKKPARSYRDRVFKKADSQLDPSAYPYELGWIFLDNPHRRKGQMTRLIDDLMPAAKESALFATTRTSNDIMRDMLAQLKFSKEGVEYKSDQNQGDMLNLFVRSTGNPDDKVNSSAT